MQPLLLQKDGLRNPLLQPIAWSVLGLYLVVQFAALLGAPMFAYDDAIPLVSADLILHGRTPAVDFWSFYPPLYYYATAAGFKLFSRTALVPRFFSFALEVMLLFAAARFFRASFPSLRSLIPFMLLPLIVSWAAFRSPSWPGLALAILSMLAYIKSRQSSPPDIRWMVFAGLVAGVSTLIRYNFGAYVILIAGADILLNDALAGTDEPARVRLRRALLYGSALVVPLALTNIVFYLWIYGASAVTAPLQTIRYSMGVMSGPAFLIVRHNARTLFSLAFPCAWLCARQILRANKIDTPALICAAGGAILTAFALLAGNSPSIAIWFPALALVSIIVFHLTVSPLPRTELALLLFCVCVQHYFLSRADSGHSVVLHPVFALMLPFLFSSQVGTDQERQGFSLKAQVVLALVVAMLLFRMNYNVREAIPFAKSTLMMFRNGGLNPNMPDRQRLLSFNDPELAQEIQATEFVRTRTAPSDPIFVGVKDHSQSFINSVRAYWLSERLPGSSYVNLDTPVGAGEAVQREIIADLQRNRVTWVILYDTSGLDPVFETTTPGSKALDEYLMNDFQEEARFGRYAVIMRRPPARAADISPAAAIP